MRLIRIEIEHFGKLSGFAFDMENGVNILCERNGWGKTTLAVFIKAMLYGLPATTKRDLDRNERKKYTPWQGGAFGGSLEFESEKGHFRVERFFGAKEAADEFRLFDLATNKESDAYSQDLGIELFGIDAAGFERSLYLSQRDLDAKDDGTAAITTKLTGLLDDVNDIGSFEVAMKVIDRQRQVYEVKGGRGRVSELKNELLTCQEELARCRELLPTQRDLEERIAQNRRALRQAEEELKEMRQASQQAALRRARMGEQTRMQNRLAEAEARRHEILRAFRNALPPSEAELTQAREQLAECRQEQATLQGYRLTHEEQTRLDAMRTRYPKGLPSPDSIARVRQELQALSDVRAERRALGNAPSSPEAERFSTQGIPQQVLLDRATEALERAEQLDRRIKQLENTVQAAPKAKKRPLLALLPLLAGGAAAIAGAAVAALRLPLLIIGAVLILIGGIWFLAGGKREQPAEDPTEALCKDRENALGLVRHLLMRYGYPYLPEAELRNSLNDLILSARAARNAEDRAHRQAAAIEQCDRRISNAEQRIHTFFASVGYSQPPKDPFGALLQLSNDQAESNRLQAKRQTLEAKQSTLGDALKEKQDALSAFLARLVTASTESNRPEERLHRMEELCREHTALLRDMEKQKQELAAFAAQNGLQADSPTPADDTLRQAEEEQERRLQALREEATDLHRRLDRISEQTQGLPDLEDEQARLTEAHKSAQEALKLLRRTAEFLTDAKEALSTRYLSDVQEHFTRYRALLEQGEASRALLDTDFNITVTEEGKSRALESFSQGRRDILQFCARLALIKAMFTEGEQPFLLLDDPFVNLDEDNLSAARELLIRLSGEFQILYFICHEGRK